MVYSIRDTQARLNALGYNVGAVDGVSGPKTRAGMAKASTERNGKLFDPSGLHRIHMHWTAGAYGDNALERKSYHILVLEDGRKIYGDLKPESNANTSDGSYVAHTRMANQGAIGVSLDAMAFAKEIPFDAGKYPITRIQLKSMVQEVADLCETYDIPVSRWSTLTHAEIQPTLGIRQRNKWDIKWIPGMDRPGDPIEVGDMIRDMIRKEL
jgi:N-acetyl-anhydromuramyl-L-alanine amidase AmpD